MASIDQYFSVLALFILFRETIEASIICGVLLQFLDRAKPALKRSVWWGVAAGVGVSIIFGVIFIAVWYTAQNNLFKGKNRDIFKGVVSWVAAILITMLAFAMLRFLGWEEKWKRKLTAAMAERAQGAVAAQAAAAAAEAEAKAKAQAGELVEGGEAGARSSEEAAGSSDLSAAAAPVESPKAMPPAPQHALQPQPSLHPQPSLTLLLPQDSPRAGLKGWWDRTKHRLLGARATGEAKVATSADPLTLPRPDSLGSGAPSSKDVDPAKDSESDPTKDVEAATQGGALVVDGHVVGEDGRDMSPATKKEKWNIWILVFATVVREGIESVVFLGGLGNVKLSAVPLPAFVGIVCGVLVGMFLYYSGKQVKHIKWLVVGMSIVLFFIAAGQVNIGTDALYKGGMFGYCSPWYDERPWFMVPIYDWSACCNDLDPTGIEPTAEQNRRRFFALVRAIFGYQDKGTPIEIIFYCSYWGVILVIAAFKWWRGTLFDADYKYTREQKRLALEAQRKAAAEAEAADAVEGGEGEKEEKEDVGASGVQGPLEAKEAGAKEGTGGQGAQGWWQRTVEWVKYR